MKKINVVYLIIIIFFAFQIIINSAEVINCITFSMEIWKSNIFPCLFPFFIISDLLVNYGFIEIINKILSPIMSIYKINKNCSFVLALSMISGFPSNARYAKKLYDEKLIDEYDASKILTFSHFSNPLFIIGTISVLLNKDIAYKILFSHFITNFIVGLFFRNYHPSKGKIKKSEIKSNSFINTLSFSINNTIDTLLLLLGIITTFLVITTIIRCNINLNPILQAFLNGLIEMTQGIKYISMIDISIKIKAITICFFLSFGGICVHIQVQSILKKTNIKYLPYFGARILHGIISSFIIFLIT